MDVTFKQMLNEVSITDDDNSQFLPQEADLTECFGLIQLPLCRWLCLNHVRYLVENKV